MFFYVFVHFKLSPVIIINSFIGAGGLRCYWLSLLFPEECITMYRYFILLSVPCFTIIFTNCFRNFSSVLFSVFTKIIIRSISIRIKKSDEKIKNYLYLFFIVFFSSGLSGTKIVACYIIFFY